MHLQIWWSWCPSSSNDTLIIQLGGFFVSWWGSYKVGRPCQGVNSTFLEFTMGINRKNLLVCYTDLKTKINLILTWFFKYFYNVIGDNPTKTSKIGCFSNFYGPLTPPKCYRPRSYMQLVNTRILHHF